MSARILTHRVAVALGLDRVAVSALRRSLLILCYHGVSEGPPDAPDPEGLQVPRELFAAQIDWIARRLRPVGIEDIQASVSRDHPLPDRSCLVTFDDGYRNVLRHALPVLRRTGVPAAVFVVAGLTESRQWLWTSAYDWVNHGQPGADSTKRWLKTIPVSERARWLSEHVRLDLPLPDCDNTLASWSELHSALEHGSLAVGSHGLGHEPLTACSVDDCRRELEQSRALIACRLGRPPVAVAYPNGDYSKEVLQMAVEAGFNLGFTTVPRHATSSDAPLALPRILVGRADFLPVFASRVSGWSEWLRWRRR